MNVRSILYKVLFLMFAAMIANQMACNKASFEAEESVVGSKAADPDNPDESVDEFDDGDTVSCAAGKTDNRRVCQRDRDRELDLDFGDGGDRDKCDGNCDDGDKVVYRPTPTKPKRPTMTFTPPKCTVTKTDEAGRCFKNSYGDITKESINGVSIWLVVDSSRSFDGERVAVANAITSGFLTALQKDVPVEISVIAGHAPSPGIYEGPVPADPDYGLGPVQEVKSSAPAINGEVFYRHKSEPLKIVLRPDMSEAQFNKAKRELLMKLGNDMRESPISLAKQQKQKDYEYDVQKFYPGWAKVGPHSGSDELGLRNFSDAMDKARVPDGYAWIVLFAADENDACTPDSDPATGKVKWSHYEDESQMYKWYCQGITPHNVYNKAKKFAGDRPHAFGALVYTLNKPIPSYAHPQAGYGEGYTKIVALAGRGHGLLMDLANRDRNGNIETDALDSVATRIVDGLAINIRNSLGIHTDYYLFDEEGGQPLSLDSIQVKNGKYNLQVIVDGEPWNYDHDHANDLIIPYYGADKSRKIKDAHKVDIVFCKKK